MSTSSDLENAVALSVDDHIKSCLIAAEYVLENSSHTVEDRDTLSWAYCRVARFWSKLMADVDVEEEEEEENAPVDVSTSPDSGA
jgi:hypothetical protein